MRCTLNKRPKVVYCLPVYNGEHEITNCLESILNQSYANLSIIIGDNNSTDNTSLICQEFAEKNSNIIYIKRHENQGSYWNHLNLLSNLSSQQSKYFVIAQCDSTYNKRHAELCIGYMESNPKAVSCLTALSIKGYNNLSKIVQDNLNSVGLKLSDRIQKGVLNDSNGLFFTGVHRTSHFENNFDLWINNSTNRLTDLELLIHAMVKGEIFVLNEVLVERSYIHSAMRNEDYNAYLERYHVANNLRQGLTIPFSNGVRKICQQLLQRKDISDINDSIESINAFTKSAIQVFGKLIDSEIQRAIDLIKQDKPDECWYKDLNQIEVSPDKKQQLLYIYTKNLLRDAIDCYTFTKIPKLKELIEVCIIKANDL
jgi:glycosyltransferase involved in cell wall biosynthesis